MLRKKVEILAMLAKQPALLALPVALFLCIPLIVHLLAPGDRQLDLGPPAAVEINRQGDERQTLAGDRALQLAISRPRSNNFRLRRGSWFMRLPWLYSGIELLISQTSSPSIAA